MSVQPKKFSYPTNLNKEIKFFGFSPLVLVGLLLGTLVSAIVSKWAPIPLGLAAFFIGRHVRKKARQGHPNYLASLFISMSMGNRGYLVDDGVFLNLKKKSK
tara:strand:+ start:346 stop:651 length:306 start_codon:yes stop_codon:yes gene_type:complete